VLGLSTFAKYDRGRYPAVKYVYGDEQGEALRKLMGMGPEGPRLDQAQQGPEMEGPRRKASSPMGVTG